MGGKDPHCHFPQPKPSNIRWRTDEPLRVLASDVGHVSEVQVLLQQDAENLLVPVHGGSSFDRARAVACEVCKSNLLSGRFSCVYQISCLKDAEKLDTLSSSDRTDR
jgi:hypothetical protein